jgi:hypothetical protein
MHLKSLGWPLVKKALASGGVLEARIEGTARDGGAVCATVLLLGVGWQQVE